MELGNAKALLGFAGSPWTLACYMIEGGSRDGFPRAVEWAKNNSYAFNQLMEKLTSAISEYLKMQIKCGVDAVQIFDSGKVFVLLKMHGTGLLNGFIKLQKI